RRTAEHDIAAGGGIEPAEQVEQGRFTTTAVSANGNEFASVDGEIDTAKSLNSSFVVVLAQVAYFQNGATHGAAPKPGKGVRRARLETLRQSVRPAWQCPAIRLQTREKGPPDQQMRRSPCLPRRISSVSGEVGARNPSGQV